MRFKKDEDIRDDNPILYDVCGDMSGAEVWSMYHRLQREIINLLDLAALKAKSVEILAQELECRGELYRA